MSDNWISYSDSEVTKYHPICQNALESALKNIGKFDTYEVVHHRATDGLIMDFVIMNRQTKKYFCVIEVKRTPSDVHSARYQFQAMSYVQSNVPLNEQPFFVLTNLEMMYTFRFDMEKPRVLQQMLSPGLIKIGFFHESKEIFLSKLVKNFEEILLRFFNNDYNYSVSLSLFQEKIENIKMNNKEWNSSLAVLLYEYIRGAFSAISRKELRDVRLFSDNVKKICNEATKINFKEIFTYDDETFYNSIKIDSKLLADVFLTGQRSIAGDLISEIIYDVVSDNNSHKGEVPTDIELARIASLLADLHCKVKPKKICDPAAGSGNLMMSALEIFNVQPNQIKVNDINKKYSSLLSIRLGLAFPSIICSSNSPKITTNNVSELDLHFFEDVDIVIMNPPFVAGINAVEEKKVLSHKIKSLTGKSALTDIGQAGLESLFLELITAFVNPGTVMVVIFPTSYLNARGPEAKATRKMLLREFGLETIFTYPSSKLFGDVMKDTLIFVGRKGSEAEEIRYLTSYDQIVDIDLKKFSKAFLVELDSKFKEISSGVYGMAILREKIISSIEDGWRYGNDELISAKELLLEIQKNSIFSSLKLTNSQLHRGSIGNSGASDLLFISNELLKIIQLEKSKIKTFPGLRNASLDSLSAGNGDSLFFDIQTNEDVVVEKMISHFINSQDFSGKQIKKMKTQDEIRAILKKSSKNFTEPHSVLIPRGCRKFGRVYYTDTKMYVSTNFVIMNTSSLDEAKILASWMSTIFYQMDCEINSKDEKGMRKMEKEDIKQTFIPNVKSISQVQKNEIMTIINNIVFLNLTDPIIRPIDIAWAKIINPNNYEAMLEETRVFLMNLSTLRQK